MIVLDTNIVSEMMRSRPDENVMAWLNAQAREALHTTSITVAEISYGLAITPVGDRGRTLRERFERLLDLLFHQRILSFDECAARRYGEVMGYRKSLGRPMSIPDGQIAAIVRLHGCRLATRNIRDFEVSGVDVVNPFDIPT